MSGRVFSMGLAAVGAVTAGVAVYSTIRCIISIFLM